MRDLVVKLHMCISVCRIRALNCEQCAGMGLLAGVFLSTAYKDQISIKANSYRELLVGT